MGLVFTLSTTIFRDQDGLTHRHTARGACAARKRAGQFMSERELEGLSFAAPNTPLRPSYVWDYRISRIA